MKMTIRETIIKKMMGAGYDLFVACESADQCIAEFKTGEGKKQTFAIYGAHGKCLDAFVLEKK